MANNIYMYQALNNQDKIEALWLISMHPKFLKMKLQTIKELRKEGLKVPTRKRIKINSDEFIEGYFHSVKEFEKWKLLLQQSIKKYDIAIINFMKQFNLVTSNKLDVIRVENLIFLGSPNIRQNKRQLSLKMGPKGLSIEAMVYSEEERKNLEKKFERYINLGMFPAHIAGFTKHDGSKTNSYFELTDENPVKVTKVMTPNQRVRPTRYRDLLLYQLYLNFPLRKLQSKRRYRGVRETVSTSIYERMMDSEELRKIVGNEDMTQDALEKAIRTMKNKFDFINFS